MSQINPENLKKEYIELYEQADDVYKKTIFEHCVNQLLEFGGEAGRLLQENQMLKQKISNFLGASGNNLGETMALAEIIMGIKGLKNEVAKELSGK